ncbi:hypothetical protein C9374_006612 [Naegleria lovaniensis]|uniref:Centromere protein J C-terminal domain-containing protein n=1 Tax=Naegleria lovaniensis TaxID=51637 RepID=A0AA88KHE7_NAELO|nr:uncharacterized protein C9374_006612 [Naegleria lovaniensis]KAG2379495.1 hypothetical protein C9374_006612 [Naegleria lovaniensis]
MMISSPQPLTPRKDPAIKTPEENDLEESILVDAQKRFNDSFDHDHNVSNSSLHTDHTDPEDPLFGKGSPLYSPIQHVGNSLTTTEGQHVQADPLFKPLESSSRQNSTTPGTSHSLNISTLKENSFEQAMNEHETDLMTMMSQYNHEEEMQLGEENGYDDFDIKAYLEKYGVNSMVDMNQQEEEHHTFNHEEEENYEDDEETQHALNFGSTLFNSEPINKENAVTMFEEHDENEEETHHDYEHSEQTTEENNHSYQHSEEQYITNEQDDDVKSVESSQDDQSEESEEEDDKKQEQRSFVLYMPKTLTPKSQFPTENNHSTVVIKSPTGSQKNINNSNKTPNSLEEKAITTNYTKNLQKDDKTKHNKQPSSPKIKGDDNAEMEYTDQYDDDNSKPKFSMLKRNSRWGSLLNKISKPGTYVPPTNKHSKAAVLSKTTTKKQQPSEETTEVKQEPSQPSKKLTSSQRKPPTPEIVERSVTDSKNEKSIPQPKRAAPAIPKNQQPIPHEQEQPLPNYFSRRDPPTIDTNTVGEYGHVSEENSYHDDDDTHEEEDDSGWGTFINRNTVYNPYHYEQRSISSVSQSPPLSVASRTSPILGGQMHPPSMATVEKREQIKASSNHSSTAFQQRTGSIISNFFLPKAQEEEKKRQMKEKIEKKKEEKKNREEEEKKLKELEEQLLFYKNENEKTKRLKDELVAERQNMECEQSEFKRQMEEERDRFEKYKQQELQKITREKRILERQLKEHQQSLSRKEHEKEVNELKDKLEKLLSEKKNESAKYKSTIQALKTRNEQLTERIAELEENLKKRELERIDNVFVNKKKTSAAQEPLSNNASQPATMTTSPQMNQQPQQSSSSNNNRRTSTNETHVNNNNNNNTSAQHVREKTFMPSVQHSNTVVNEPHNHDRKTNMAPSSSNTNKSPSKSAFSYPTPYPNNHKLALLKRTYKVSDQEFVDGEIEWEPLHVSNDKVTSKVDMGNGKIEIKYRSGRRDIQFSNGTTKKLYPDKSCLVFFNNGDIKKTFEDGVVVYYYASLQTTHVSYPNGLEMYKFPNTQLERHFPSGEKEIVFPDKTVKFVNNDGMEEIWFADGTHTQTLH